MFSPLARLCLPFAVAALLAGCVGAPAPDCGKFDQSRRQTDYATHYAVSEPETARRAGEFRPLGKATAAAPLYRLTLNMEEIRACTHLTITKELFLQRNPGRGDVLEETRELFAENGKLITARKEIVTAQLPGTGFYTAAVPLPVPKGTAAGKYRIASRLILKPRGNARQLQVLAQASAGFVVVPPTK